MPCQSDLPGAPLADLASLAGLPEKLANLASLPDRLGVGPPRGNAIDDALAAIRRHDAASYGCESVEGANAIAQARAILETATTPEPPLGGTCAHCHRPMPDTVFALWMAQNGQTYQSLAKALWEAEGRMAAKPSKNLVFRLAHHWPRWKPRPATARRLQILMDLTGLPREAFQSPLPGNGGYYFEPGTTAGIPDVEEPTDG